MKCISTLMIFWSPSSDLILDRKIIRFENVLVDFEDLKQVKKLRRFSKDRVF